MTTKKIKTVRIYSNPYDGKDCEGIAKIKKIHFKQYFGQNLMYYADVVFPDEDDVTVSRWFREQDIIN